MCHILPTRLTRPNKTPTERWNLPCFLKKWLLLLFLLGIPGCIHAEESSEVAPTASKPASAENVFAVKWFQQCVSEKKEENAVCSPLNTYFLAGSLLLGSDGKTLEEWQTVLGETHPREVWQEILQQRQRTLRNARLLKMAHSVWVQEDYPVKSTYIESLWNALSAEVRNVNFGKKEIRKEINGWFEQKTDGKIPQMLESLSPETKLLVANALVFQGKWKKAFDPEETRKGYFTNLHGKESRVSMMQQTRHFNYYQGKGFQWLEMPYQGEDFSMVLLLPESWSRFQTFEKKLTAEFLEECASKGSLEEVDVRIPSFAMECQWDVIRTLKEMGVRDSFTTTADFGPISEANDLMISGVRQKVVLKVDEKGTEAAAGSAAMFVQKAVAKVPRFYADRPFLFFVTEKESGRILLAGHLVQPENLKEESTEAEKPAVVESSDSERKPDDSDKQKPNSETSSLHTRGVGGNME